MKISSNSWFILALWSLFICAPCLGQIQGLHFNTINKKTKQWIEWTGDTRYLYDTTGKTSYDSFLLVIKRDKCEKRYFAVNFQRTKQFLDSLKKAGNWADKVKYKSGEERYVPSIELKGIAFLYLDGKSDSVYQFVYKIILTDLHTKIVKYQTDTIEGTEKQKVLNTFANKAYSFDKVMLQKGTSIIFIGIDSDGLYRTYKEEYYRLVFAPWRRYYF